MKYQIIQIPIKKYFETNDIKAVVGHVDLGTESRTVDTLKGAKQASYHYYLPREREVIIQFVPIEKGAWHAGVVKNPTQKAKDLFGSVNPNKQSLALCYGGKPLDASGNVNWNWKKVVDGEKATNGQVNRGVWLLKELELDELPFIAHKEITSYKPKCVLDFIERVDKAKESDHVCSLSSFTVPQMMREIIRRFNS